jgi:predicted transcriptional regulator
MHDSAKGASMETTLTVRLSERESAALKKLSKATGKSRSEIVREAIRNETFRARLTELRARLVPRARAAGWLTEDDIFRDVS